MQSDEAQPQEPGQGGDWLDRFIASEALPEAARIDFEQHFSCVARWLRHRCDGQPPYLLGINGAQGSGKSTLARYLQAALQRDGLRVALASLDDFYLPQADRWRLAKDIHPLLAVRGVPGTHDAALMKQCLERLKTLRAGENIAWPRFDKSADDRSGESQSFTGPVDIILFEGWCVGTQPENSDSLGEPINELEASQDADGSWRAYVNKQLATDYASVFQLLDGLCFLAVPDLAAVRRWRTEQEHRLIARTGDGMSDDEVAAFILYFERLTRVALRELPYRADCVLYFDDAHRCIRSRFADSAC